MRQAEQPADHGRSNSSVADETARIKMIARQKQWFVPAGSMRSKLV
jgi:hypothetical protein